VPKFGRSSVDRNRLKRRLREIVRTQLLETLPQVDAVIRIRPTTYDVPFSTLADELRDTLVEARRLFP